MSTLREAAQKLVQLAEAGKLTGPHYAARCEVDFTIGRLRAALAAEPQEPLFIAKGSWSPLTRPDGGDDWYGSEAPPWTNDPNYKWELVKGERADHWYTRPCAIREAK